MNHSLYRIHTRFNVRRLFHSRYGYSHSHGFCSSPLYKKISPLGDPNISMTPVLDQWVRDGNNVTKEELRNMIKELRSYKRFKHALEISHWMSNKMYFPLSSADCANRLNLIWSVHGIEQVENYFNDISVKLKCFPVYSALLSCYVQEKAVEKAERTFQKMKNLGIVTEPVPYNLLMKLYHETGNTEKLDNVMSEMEKEGVRFDKYTLCTRLSSYAATSDIEGIDRIVELAKSYHGLLPDWSFYAIVVGAYLQVGRADKAMPMMQKLERQVTAKPKYDAFDQLLSFCGKIGKRDELFRIWSLYKEKLKVYNRGYKKMILNLLRLNDIEAAEKIFEEWESAELSYDFRVPNLLIDAYCSNNLLEKAESLINREVEKGVEPSVDAWCSLVSAFLEADQIPKAKEALKKAILADPPSEKHKKETLAICLEYLEGKGDQNNVEKFVELLRSEGIFSPIVHNRLLTYIKGEEQQSHSV